MKERNIIKIFVNFITTFRLIYTFFLLLLIHKVSNPVFMIHVIVLFLTDAVDGFLARKFHVQTIYGSVMDTVADKVLCITLLLLLIPSIPSISFILLGEICISFINVIGKSKGKETKSSYIGKIKMWLLAITILLGFMYIFQFMENKFIFVGISITFIMQVITFIGYIHDLKKQKNKNIKKLSIKNRKECIYILFSTDYYFKQKQNSI